jgi:1-deoxy-D-xylulose-5-phosphate reductoisomerase
MAKSIAILGSTGSIGTGVLDVVDRLPGRFEVTGLAAGGNLSLLAAQIKKFRPGTVSVTKKGDVESLRPAAKLVGARILSGPEGAEAVASLDGTDIVVSAITGINGFRPTMAAVRMGKTIALANKESMVVGGQFLQQEAKKSGSRIIPVDSEHSGVFQCLAGANRRQVQKIILTASGGPFFRTPLKDLKHKTLEETLRHPRWKMGRKVTIDSATLMNKGLELIEARWLFGIEPERLGVLIHPQSAVHSIVEMSDGSFLAQMSATDMRIPIQYALTYPARVDSALPRLDLGQLKRLDFHEVDSRRYPLFDTARQALSEGESLPAALNAANEETVAAFLERKIRFSDIPDIIRRVMDGHHKQAVESIASIYQIDREARRKTRRLLQKRD